jgi:hypothetical protein
MDGKLVNQPFPHFFLVTLLISLLASELTSTVITNWNGTDTSLAAVKNSKPDTLRTYYIGDDQEIYGFHATPGDAFMAMAGQSAQWDTSDTQGPGAIAGIGWSDQVRLYYVSGGKIVQSALSNTTWGTSSNF